MAKGIKNKRETSVKTHKVPMGKVIRYALVWAAEERTVDEEVIFWSM